MKFLATVFFGVLVGGGTAMFMLPRNTLGFQLSPNKLRHLTFTGPVYALGGGFIGFIVTGWPAAALLFGSLIWLVPRVLASNNSRSGSQLKDEALATWTEQLRDTIAAASGIEQAIITTACVAPDAISESAERLSKRMAYVPTAEALKLFADEVDTTSCDFLVSALIIATQHQARDLAGLLTQLADSTREECRSATRIWVGRARTRSAIKIIVGSVVVFLLALYLFDREYLAPYGSGLGQFILMIITALFVGALIYMQRLAESDVKARFVVRESAGTT